MHIILGLYLGDERGVKYFGYNELESQNIPGISFVNVIYGSVGAVNILPIIVYRDKPINRYIMSGKIRGEEVPYNKDVFENIKAELKPFAERHKHNTDLYLYSDLFFIPKKESIKDFKPIDRLIEEGGYIHTSDNADIETEFKTDGDSVKSLLEMCKVEVPKVQTVEELIREQQTGRQVDNQYVESDWSAQTNELSQDSNNFNHEDPKAMPFDSSDNSVQIDDFLKLVTDLDNFIKTTNINSASIGTTQQIMETRRNSCSWVLLSYLQLLANKCANISISSRQAVPCSDIWGKLVNIAWSLGLINGVYFSINAAPNNLKQLEKSILSLYTECKKSIIAQDKNSSMLSEYTDMLKNLCGYEKGDLGINGHIGQMNNKSIIAFKYIVKIINETGFTAIGDYDSLCLLYLVTQKHLQTSYRSTMDLQQRIFSVRQNIEKAEIHTAWFEMCSILSKLQY